MTQQAKQESEHGQAVAKMFGRIAIFYDFLNHFLSLGQDIIWRKELVKGLFAAQGQNGLVLDLAAGTLDVSLEIARRHPASGILAADFSLPMLRRGQSKLSLGLKKKLQPVLADGFALPLPDASVDAVSIAFGIRNMLPRIEAMREMHRVLKPGGRLSILEFGTAERPILKGIYNIYLDRLLPLLGRVISGDCGAYRYLADTIRGFPKAEQLRAELRQAGFRGVSYRPLSFGVVYIHQGTKF